MCGCCFGVSGEDKGRVEWGGSQGRNVCRRLISHVVSPIRSGGTIP